MNPIHVHLVLNHLPLVGVLLGWALLQWGVLRGREEIKESGLAVLGFSALCSVPVFLSGRLAAPLLRSMNVVPQALVERHAQAAAAACLSLGVLGLLCAWVLGRSWFDLRAPRRAYPAASLLALATVVLAARAAWYGGQIRHSEIQSDWKEFRMDSATLGLAGCAGLSIAPDRYYPVAAEEAARLVGAGGVFILDVRPPDDFERQHIPGAVSIPKSQLWRRADEVPDDKGLPILVYDDTPSRSAYASYLLKSEGHTRVFELTGGLEAWKAAGQPVEGTGVGRGTGG